MFICFQSKWFLYLCVKHTMLIIFFSGHGSVIHWIHNAYLLFDIEQSIDGFIHDYFELIEHNDYFACIVLKNTDTTNFIQFTNMNCVSYVQFNLYFIWFVPFELCQYPMKNWSKSKKNSNRAKWKNHLEINQSIFFYFSNPIQTTLLLN